MRIWLEYIPFITMAAIVRALPRRAAMAFGRRLGALGRRLQPGRATLASDNLTLAFPETTAAEREAILRKAFEHLGTSLIDMLRLDLLAEEDALAAYFTVEGRDNLDAALGHGRGVIMLTGHLGFWEAGTFLLPHLGYRTGFVTKTIRNPLIDAYFRRMREASGGYNINSRKGARRILKALRENHIVGILMDQHIRGQQGSVAVPFFGQPAHTTTTITQLAMKQQVPIVPAFAYRQPGDTYLVRFSPPFFLQGDESPETILENTALLNRAIEDGIRHDISQWFWVHRRWRDCCARAYERQPLPHRPDRA